jgi:hypothetical protein
MSYKCGVLWVVEISYSKGEEGSWVYRSAFREEWEAREVVKYNNKHKTMKEIKFRAVKYGWVK